MPMEILKIDSDAALEDAGRRLSTAGDPQAEGLLEERTETVGRIVQAVRERGDEAVAEFSKRFDGVELRPEDFELSSAEIDSAVSDVERGLIEALERAHENIRRYHAMHLRESWEEEFEDGVILGQRITPIERVGVYVPGGKAFYPSSVLMNIAAARVAGVPEIVMVSPPSYGGTIHPVVLAAARIAGVSRVFRVGGAQAVAALAYGTKCIPQVLKITGPGNVFVTVAKRLVRHVCDIDTEAGPSEVVVIADAKANPRYVAGELLAQAEHDEDARSILLTTSEQLAQNVAKVVEEELQRLSRSDIIQKSLAANGALVVVRDLMEAAALSNRIAPEHLALYTEAPRDLLKLIRNAGAIMLGETTTVVLGDYFAGPNHILPTAGKARFASPLSAEDFRKVSSTISYTAAGIDRVADDIRRIATAEELTAHARAIEIRAKMGTVPSEARAPRTVPTFAIRNATNPIPPAIAARRPAVPRPNK